MIDYGFCQCAAQMSGLGNDVSLMDCIFFFLSMTQFESGDAESCGKAAT